MPGRCVAAGPGIGAQPVGLPGTVVGMDDNHQLDRLAWEKAAREITNAVKQANQALADLRDKIGERQRSLKAGLGPGLVAMGSFSIDDLEFLGGKAEAISEQVSGAVESWQPAVQSALGMHSFAQEIITEAQSETAERGKDEPLDIR